MDDWVPPALGRLDLDSLIGLSDAEARARVEEAGGLLQSVAPGKAFGLPYQPGLVTAMIEEDLVSSVLGIQGRVADDYVPHELARLNLDSLIGLGVVQARSRVERAGGELSVRTSWNVPFDSRPWRVTVQIVADQVIRVLGRG